MDVRSRKNKNAAIEICLREFQGKVMRVSELWLKKYLSLPHSIAAIGEQLTNAGLEVDGIEKSADQKQDILTLKIPPNRGDCLSMEGIVREIALLNQQSFHEAPIALIKPDIHDVMGVKVESPVLCPRYVGRIISDIKPNTKTPEWIKERLEWAGLRSISLIVDLTNYVMLEMGQPLHAFDLAKIQGHIEVRLAKPAETLVLLDEKEITLDPETLVIADINGPLAIAGVMGGLESGVTEASYSVFIESAYFNPVSVRLSAKRFGLMTDASYRFERGIDPELQIRAIERMTSLLLECSSNAKAGPIIEVKSDSHLPKNPEISLRLKRIESILGKQHDAKIVQDILQRAHLTVEQNESNFLVTAPSFRHDIQLEIDVIEEIARIIGFTEIPSLIPISPFQYIAIPEKKIPKERLKQILVDRGYSETINYSFIAPKWQNLLQVPESIVLKNPLSIEMSMMRMSLLPGLLQAVQHNQRRQLLRNRFFEMGNVFLKEKGERVEKTFLSGISTGSRFKEQWGSITTATDFYDIKQDVEALLSLTKRADMFQFVPANHPTLHPGQSASIIYNDRELGIIGALHPQLLKTLDLLEPVFVFELEWSLFSERALSTFQPLSKFPAIRRDIAVLVDTAVFASTLKSAIVKCAGEWLQDVSIFDVYQGKGIELGKKSIALGLVLQHPSRTLIDTEVAALVEQVLTMLSTEFKATLRE